MDVQTLQDNECWRIRVFGVSFGRCPWVKFSIDTGDHPPIKFPARPIPLHYREKVIRQYTKLLKDGTVRPSHSEWASPILCIPAKTGDIRICAVTKIPATPIPTIQDLLEKLAGKRYYLLCDVAFGYHHIEIAEKDVAKTAIILPDNLGLPSRHLEYIRLRFGLAAAPGLFQSVTDRLIAPGAEKTIDNDLGEFVAVYLEDICIGADTFQELLQRTNALFNRLRAAVFLFKAKKCNLFHTELAYLGHTIDKCTHPSLAQVIQQKEHLLFPVMQVKIQFELYCLKFKMEKKSPSITGPKN